LQHRFVLSKVAPTETFAVYVFLRTASGAIEVDDEGSEKEVGLDQLE
jgi:hypothetical protein